MNVSVSIVICTFNGSKRLPKTLTHLATQKAPSGILWEVLVLDNASTDDTTQVALSYEAHFAPGTLRVLSVPEPGKSNALIRAIREVRHDIMCVIDDDNWVAADWVERVSRIFAEHPEIGYCGGRSDAVFEIDPPAWLEPIKNYYAIGSQFQTSGEVTTSPGVLIWGAGSCMRTSAVRKLMNDGFTFRLISRKGNQLTSSGDSELCLALRGAGCRFWYEDDLVLQHFIPKERLRWSYPLRLLRGMGQSSVMLELYFNALNQPPFHNRPLWKRGWFYAVLRTARAFVPLVFKHPLQCMQQPEGSSVALQFKRGCGRWAALWAVRGHYAQIRDEITTAKWVRQN